MGAQAGSLADLAMHTPDVDVSVIVNSDILLTQSFVSALLAADAEFDAWFLTGVCVSIHYSFEERESNSNCNTHTHHCWCP